MLSTKMKMSLLVAAHVVAGVVLAWAGRPFRYDPIRSAGLVALLFADSGLVGVWGGLSLTRLTWRFPAVLVAILYFWGVMSFEGFNPSIAEYLMIAFPTVALVMVLIGLWHSRYGLYLAHLPDELPLPNGFQFSIRHLLLATAIVAIVLGVWRGVQSISEHHYNFRVLVTIPLCIIVVELATLWATLGMGRLLLRLAVIVALAFGIGMIPLLLFGQEADLQTMTHFSSIFGFQAIISAASLLVVRSCGWRLVSGATGDGMRSDGNDADAFEAVGDDQSPWMKIGVQKFLLKVVNP